MKFHELFYAIAVEAQRFDAEIPPEALELVEFGLKQVQRARTFEEFQKALSAVAPGPRSPDNLS